MLAVRAVRESGSDAAVVNAAYPDAVHRVLATVGLSPHIGIGKRLPAEYRRTGGMAGQAMTAGSALGMVEPLPDQLDAFVHAPGPLGRLGGYPAALGSDGIRLVLSDGMTEEQALAINVSGQVQDVITEIRSDGSVRFEPAAAEILAKMPGYNCTESPLSQAEARAEELGRRFAEFRRGATA